MVWNCRWLKSAGVVLLGLTLVGTAAYAAGSKRIEFALIRVADPQDEAVIEVPLKVLETLEARSVPDLEVCQVKGEALKVSLGTLLQALREKKANREEVPCPMVQGAQPVAASLYVKRAERKVAENEAPPSKLVFTTRQKDSKVVTKVSVSLDAMSEFARNFAGQGGRSLDFNAFIKSCLDAASGMGQGPLLRIVNREGEQGFELE